MLQGEKSQPQTSWGRFRAFAPVTLPGICRGFQILCRESHPPFYRLIPKLIAVEVNAQKTVCERGHGTTHLKKKVYNNLSSKMKKIIAQRDPQKITETLEKCAHLVKFSHHKVRASIVPTFKTLLSFVDTLWKIVKKECSFDDRQSLSSLTVV